MQSRPKAGCFVIAELDWRGSGRHVSADICQAARRFPSYNPSSRLSECSSVHAPTFRGFLAGFVSAMQPSGQRVWIKPTTRISSDLVLVAVCCWWGWLLHVSVGRSESVASRLPHARGSKPCRLALRIIIIKFSIVNAESIYVALLLPDDKVVRFQRFQTRATCKRPHSHVW